MKSKRKETRTESRSPASWAAPALQGLTEQAYAAAGQVPKTPFVGDYYAPFQPLQQQGLAQQEAALPTLGLTSNLQLANAVGAMRPQTEQPITYSPFVGPTRESSYAGVQPLINEQIRPIMERYQRELIPQMQSQAIASGAYSTSAYEQDLPTLLSQSLAREVGGLATQLGETAYQSDRAFDSNRYEADRQYAANMQLLAPQIAALRTETDIGRRNAANNLLSAAGAASMSPGQAAYGIGAMQQQNQQQLLQQELQRYLASIQAPFNGLAPAASIVGQLSSPYYTGASETTQTSQGSLLQGLMGLAGLAASAYTGGMIPGLGGGGAGGAGQQFAPTSQFVQGAMNAPLPATMVPQIPLTLWGR